jgi:hypothetical protein
MAEADVITAHEVMIEGVSAPRRSRRLWRRHCWRAPSTGALIFFRRLEQRRLARTIHGFDALPVLTGSTASANP